MPDFTFSRLILLLIIRSVKLCGADRLPPGVSRGVPRSRRLRKKKKSRAVQSSRHFTPYFLRDCVVRAVKRPLPEDRHKLESRGIRKSHSRVGNRSVCERIKPASTFSSADLFLFFFLVQRATNVLKSLAIARIFRRILCHTEIGFLYLHASLRRFPSVAEFEAISRRTRGAPRTLSASIGFVFPMHAGRRAFSLPVARTLKADFPIASRGECERQLTWRRKTGTL